MNGTKNPLFFLSRAPIQQFLYELKHKVRPSKTLFGLFLFRSYFVFIKVCIMFQQNAWTLRLKNVIFPFKIKIIEKPHILLLLDLLEIFKLQQEVLKLNSICVSWNSPKIDPETNFLNLQNRSFENVSFSQ